MCINVKNKDKDNMKFNKIWVGTEHKYGTDYKIDGEILTVIYDTCYSLYELDKDGIIWLLMSENNSLNELNLENY